MSCGRVLQSHHIPRSRPNCSECPPRPPLPSVTAGQWALIRVNTLLPRDRTVSPAHWPPRQPPPPSAHQDCPSHTHCDSVPARMSLPQWSQHNDTKLRSASSHTSFILLKALLSSTTTEYPRGNQGTAPRRQEHRGLGCLCSHPKSSSTGLPLHQPIRKHFQINFPRFSRKKKKTQSFETLSLM